MSDPGEASADAVAGETGFERYIGMTTGVGTVVVERAAVTQFAQAVTDYSAIYSNAEVAKAAGFDNIPTSPTFAFALQSFGKWAELQPPHDPDAHNPMIEVMGGLMMQGGLILHGEQSFTYHRPMVVGDRLDYRGQVTDIYQKATGAKTMTFMVMEDRYTDADGNPVLTATTNLIHRSA